MSKLHLDKVEVTKRCWMDLETTQLHKVRLLSTEVSRSKNLIIDYSRSPSMSVTLSVFSGKSPRKKLPSSTDAAIQKVFRKRKVRFL